MTDNENKLVTISLWFSVLLTLGHLVTTIAIIILFRAFLSLKRIVQEYEKHLPLEGIEATRCKETTAIEAPQCREPATKTSISRSTEKAMSLKWHRDGEITTMVPSPCANRRTGCEHQETFCPEDCNVVVPRAQSTSGQKMPELAQEFSLGSFNSPRDSGTGSTVTGSPQGSISFHETQTKARDSYAKTEENSKLLTRMSRGSEGCKSLGVVSFDATFESSRTTSSLSNGPYSLRRNELTVNENNLGISRMETMAIEMVGVNEKKFPGDTKSKRASRLLKESKEAKSKEFTAIENVGIQNTGYHDDHNTSNRSSSEFSTRAPLAREESFSTWDSESAQLEINNNNDVKNLDSEEEEYYVNQEILNAMRYGRCTMKGRILRKCDLDNDA